ncbi:hypothetical protein RHMOL_Rhmol05G0047000 [Rhododendron molle]|uniref:Uncharacterized protein n=1 Tax=Rhododendron molle TaxID=49168 RepID=A0ACC0NM49_RHOML|nr:hypothetical protein RHMOL_Rhmol05G0047000 [Rhododendron molle]
MVAIQEKFQSVIFESDCKSLITYINDPKSRCPSEVEAVVNDIKEWARTRHWSFNWCRRVQIRAAHWIASKCCLSRDLLSFSDCIPSGLSILCKDLS